MSVDDVDLALTRPVRPGRGIWRMRLAERTFSLSQSPVVIGDIMEARSRRVTLALNKPATITFTVPGDSGTGMLARELAHEVQVFRWDDVNGLDYPVTRGVITASQDTLSEQIHTVNFTCTDYLGLLGRRYLTRNQYYQQQDQDTIMRLMVMYATYEQNSSPQPGLPNGVSFSPANWFPMLVGERYPDGSNRPPNSSGVLRDRTYVRSSNVLDLIDNLSSVINGFDYDCAPASTSFGGTDTLRVFYPYKGVERQTFAFDYGSTVSSVSRYVNSSEYANYVRVTGHEADPDIDPPFAEAWNSDANDIIGAPQGLWMDAQSAADVTEQNTLNELAAGALEYMGTLVPSYTLGLRPGVYYRGAFEVGDVVPLHIRSGRLAVESWVRVLATTFNIGDDGQEDIEVTVGRVPFSFFGLVRAANKRLSALERR